MMGMVEKERSGGNSWRYSRGGSRLEPWSLGIPTLSGVGSGGGVGLEPRVAIWYVRCVASIVIVCRVPSQSLEELRWGIKSTAD